MTRQQRRANERRKDKPNAAPINRTSRRHMGRTKAMPFSRSKLISITPSGNGKPAVFVVGSYTRKTATLKIKATLQNIDYFVKVPDSLKSAMLGY